MSFQLFTTLLLKKFLLISRRPCLTFRLRGFAELRVALTLSAALSNHWFESRLPRPHKILWTMAMSAWLLEGFLELVSNFTEASKKVKIYKPSQLTMHAKEIIKFFSP